MNLFARVRPTRFTPVLALVAVVMALPLAFARATAAAAEGVVSSFSRSLASIDCCNDNALLLVAPRRFNRSVPLALAAVAVAEAEEAAASETEGFVRF